MASAITTSILNRNSTKGRYLGIDLKNEMVGFNGKKYMVGVTQPYFYLSIEPSNEHYKDYMILLNEGRIRHCVTTRSGKFFDYIRNKEFTSLEAWYEDSMGPSAVGAGPMTQNVRFGRHRTNNYSYGVEGSVSLEDLLEKINSVHVSVPVVDTEMTLEDIYNKLGNIGRRLFRRRNNKIMILAGSYPVPICIFKSKLITTVIWRAYTDPSKQMTTKLSDMGATPSDVFFMSDNANYISLQELLDTKM
jgi:hypothetical protein